MYSNQGYALIGILLEEMTGKSFETLLSEEILTPLFMENTIYSDEEKVGLYGYLENKEEKTLWNTGIFSPTLGLVSSFGDVEKFLKALFFDKKDSNPLLGTLSRQLISNDYRGNSIDVWLVNNEKDLWLKGSTYSSRSIVYHNAKDETVYFFCSNTYLEADEYLDLFASK